MVDVQALADFMRYFSTQAWGILDDSQLQASLQVPQIALARALGLPRCEIVLFGREPQDGQAPASPLSSSEPSTPQDDTPIETAAAPWARQIGEAPASYGAAQAPDEGLLPPPAPSSSSDDQSTRLSLALTVEGRSIGALNLWHGEKTAPLTADEQALARELAAALAATLVRQRPFQAPDEALLAYRMVLDAITDPALLMARDSSIRIANRAACALTQYPATRLEQMRSHEVYAGLDEGLVRQLAQALEREQRCEMDVTIRCGDGSTVPMEVTGYLVEVGGEAMCLALHRNRHEAERAEVHLRRRLERLEALHSFSAEMTAQWQADKLLEDITERAITLLNASVGGLYLYNPEKNLLELRVVHKLQELYVAPCLQPGEGAVGQAFAMQSLVNIPDYAQYAHAIPNLREQVTSVLAVPLRWQDQCLGVLVISDRDHAHRFTPDDEHLVSLMTHHAAIVLSQARLFAELQNTYADLQRANAELLQLDRMKDDLLAAVTHELQQPLTHARLNIDVLMQRPEQFSEEQRAMLTRAIYYIDVQHRLISDLLYMISADRISPEERVPLDLGSFVQDIFSRFRAEAESKRLVYELDLPDGPIECPIEPYSLERALANVIGNAIKFTNTGHVYVRVSAEQALGQALVRVQDTGIGIAPDYQERIFQRFYQVNAGTTRAFGGLGIGLATAHRIVTGHGGTIEVLSEPGVGSEFIIRLPLASRD